MDFGAIPPEINSARMYAGPGPHSMLAAATAWNGLAAELQSTASSYESVVAGLTDDSWTGPSSMAMEDAATPYVAWLNSVAAQAEQTASQANAAAAAYQSAFAMTVPPALITANRTQLASLMATNVFGQNTSAIAANEAQYGEMWAQDAAAMYGYAANSAAAAQVSPFAEAPQTTSPAASGVQSAAVTQAAGTAAGNAQSSLSGMISQALQSLSTPVSAASTDSGLSTLLTDLESALGIGGTATTGVAGFGSVGEGLISQLLYLPAFFGAFVGLDALGPVMGNMETAAMTPVAPPADAGAAGGAEGAAAGAEGGAGWAGDGAGSGFAGDSGAWASAGDAPSLGGMSVPPNWAWSAAPPPPEFLLPGGALGAAAGSDLGAAGLGFPFAFGGLPKAAAVAAAAGVGGAAASKYASRLKVVARSPEAGYAADDEPAASSPSRRYAVPAAAYTNGNGNGNGNGHAPPGYRAAIVYLPTNGHDPAHK
jgi:PPE-repeat protein